MLEIAQPGLCTRTMKRKRTLQLQGTVPINKDWAKIP